MEEWSCVNGVSNVCENSVSNGLLCVKKNGGMEMCCEWLMNMDYIYIRKFI